MFVHTVMHFVLSNIILQGIQQRPMETDLVIDPTGQGKDLIDDDMIGDAGDD